MSPSRICARSEYVPVKHTDFLSLVGFTGLKSRQERNKA